MQLDVLNKIGCKRIFTDKLSGAHVERPGLKDAMSHLREADSLVVWKLDRLGRSVKGLVDLVNQLESQKVHFQSIADGVDTKTPAGRFFFHVMASLAQMERELTLERTRAGLEAARCAGRVGGRKRRMTDGKVQAARKLLGSGMPTHEVAHSLGVSVPTLYRWVPASSRAYGESFDERDKIPCYRAAMIPTNATVIRKAYDDFANGNIPAVLEAFDISITWYVPGHSPLSGDYQGLDEVVGFFKHTMELSGGTFGIEVHHVLAEEDVVVVLVTVKAERNGRSAAFPEVHVWRLANEKVTEFREFQGDEYTEDRFWS
jgi:DNA invertase Pin-like site-specific DNA recombinase/ketosteroid isomerase-like protein